MYIIEKVGNDYCASPDYDLVASLMNVTKTGLFTGLEVR